MKKRFAHEFGILILLAFAIGVIILQSNFKFTGYAVSDYTNQTSCEAANYSWVNNTCVDLSVASASTTTNSTITNSTDLNSTVTNSTDTTNSTVTCAENWACTDWTDCTDGTQTRTCTDSNSCGTTNDEPVLSQTCTSACVENWTCTDWTDCTNGNKTRTCTDSNSCGTTLTEPSIIHECVSATTTPDTTSTTATADAIQQTPTCSPNWNCGDWQECINGTQVRACTDSNNCGIQEGMPETSQACTSPIVNETQTQSKQNFFNLVGSVIKGPIGAVGNFFSNKTNVFISSGVLVAVVLGFFTFRFFSKHRISVSKR